MSDDAEYSEDDYSVEVRRQRWFGVSPRDDARIVAIVITNTRRGNSPYLLPRETIECGESQKPSVPPTVKLKPATDCEALPAADVLMTR